MNPNIRNALLGVLVLISTTALASQDMTDAEVRKIDKDAGKVTLKHGEIKNLDMPPMTMVFRVKEPALLDTLKVGDKVRIAAEKLDGNYTVTKIEKPTAKP